MHLITLLSQLSTLNWCFLLSCWVLDTHTNTQNNYCNSRCVCAPRVNELRHTPNDLGLWNLLPGSPVYTRMIVSWIIIVPLITNDDYNRHGQLCARACSILRDGVLYNTHHRKSNEAWLAGLSYRTFPGNRARSSPSDHVEISITTEQLVSHVLLVLPNLNIWATVKTYLRWKFCHGVIFQW